MKKRLPSAQKDRVGAKETNARKRKGQAIPPALCVCRRFIYSLWPGCAFCRATQRAEGFLPLPVIALFDYAVGFKDMIQLVIGKCA